MRALVDCRWYVAWKLLLVDDTVVQVVFQVLGALTAAMAVEDSEDLDVRPILNCRVFVWRMNYIEDDCYSVFVVLPDQPDICVGCKAFDAPESFVRDLAVLKVRKSMVVVRCRRTTYGSVSDWLLNLTTEE